MIWYVRSLNKANDQFSSFKEEILWDISIFKVDHANHKNRKAYSAQLKAIKEQISCKTNIGSEREYYIKVFDGSGFTQVLAKAQKSKTGNVDLSEIVKHCNAHKDAMNVLMGWAVVSAGVSKVSLTAAYLRLVSVYKRYGFFPNPPNIFEHDSRPLDTEIYAHLEMSQQMKEHFRDEYRPNVVWNFADEVPILFTAMSALDPAAA